MSQIKLLKLEHVDSLSGLNRNRSNRVKGGQQGPILCLTHPKTPKKPKKPKYPFPCSPSRPPRPWPICWPRPRPACS